MDDDSWGHWTLKAFLICGAGSRTHSPAICCPPPCPPAVAKCQAGSVVLMSAGASCLT